ncbi:HlyD family secretion protein [Nostoc sp.]|uniref:HlyD family secretion protein n=1 Tax=Nostoc sp. TaxID=1180 RepID=UPI002FFAFCB7
MAQTVSKYTESLPAPVEPTKQHRTKAVPLMLAMVTIAGIGYLFWSLQPQPRADILKASGRIEGYETEIGVKHSGRIESIAVREGAAVKKGQKLIKLDNSNDQLLQGQLQSANAQVASAKSDEQQAHSDVERVQGEIEEVNSQILEAQLNLQQSRGDTVGQVNQARANTAAAKAQVVQAQAVLKQAAAEVKLAKINRDRYVKLLNDGAVTQQQSDQTQTTFDTAIATLQARQAAVNAASEQLSATQAALTQAQSTGFNPGIRNAQLEALKRKRAQTSAQMKSAWAQVKSAQAKVKVALASKQQLITQIQDSNKDLNVVSPLNGVVTARSVEPGAVVDSQTNILTVIDPYTIYLRGFIPEGDIGKVRQGQVAKIFLDSAPNKPLKGKVIAIDAQASFTPENIYFQKDRVKQVVGIRISVANPASCFNPKKPYAGADLPCAKIGMPADAEILLKGAE